MKIFQDHFEKDYHERFTYREAPFSQRNRKRLNLLLEYRSQGKLLEIGCGKAGFLRLAEDHFDVEGMDVSRYAIESIRHHFGERVSVVDVEQRPLPRDKYDVIVVYNILEHLRRPAKVIEKLSGALRGGGLLIGSVPNNQSLVGGTVTRLGNFFDRTHVSTFSPPTWQRLFEKAGFVTIEFFGEVTVGRNRAYYLRTPAWPHLAFNLMFVCQK